MNQPTAPGTASTSPANQAQKKEPNKTAAPKEAAPKKEPKEKKEGAAARPRLPKLPEEHVITVLKPNAKRGASAERFNAYVTGMTVKQYIDKMTAEPFNRTVGEVWMDIRWDTDPNRNFIHIGPTVVPVPPPPEPKAKEAKETKKDEKPAQQAAPAQGQAHPPGHPHHQHS